MQKRFDKYQPERIFLIGGKFEENVNRFQDLQDKLIKETNKYNIIPYNPEILKKTTEEKKILKDVKKGYNLIKKNIVRYKETRDEIIHLIVKSRTPDFGSLKISVK